jgi:DNA-binding MarR family transcriptional regulator
MTETAATSTEQASIDFGQALGSILRSYLDNARDAVSDLPGGPRAYQVMSVANGDECSNQVTIATRLGIDRTVMTYLVDDLEKAGLVTRRPDPTDRRSRQVVLTAKGAKTFAAASKRIADVERAVLGNLPDEDADTFRQLLLRVAAAGPVVEACDVPGVGEC